MLVRVGQQVGRAHEEEEAGVDREQLAERLLGDVERGADDRAQQRRDRDDREPGDRTPPRPSLVQDEATEFNPSAKSCATTARKTSTPVAVSTLNAIPIPRPSMNVWIATAPAPSAPTWL